MTWNSLTSEVALAIDNDQQELEFVCGHGREMEKKERNHSMLRVKLGDFLQRRYGEKLTRLANFGHTRFDRSMIDAVINEVVGAIDWVALAGHYLAKVRDGVGA